MSASWSAIPTARCILPTPEPRFAVLVSGSGTNLQALLDSHARGELGATPAAVISNRPDAGALARAERAGAPTRVVDHTAYPDRSAFDADLGDALAEIDPDWIVLAGFMRILTPELIRRFEGRLINIHPSLLPAFRGLDTHRQALEAGCKLHGTTAHFVTEELDSGPIIAQSAVEVADDDTPDSLRERVQAAEHQLLPQVVRWLAEGRLTCSGQRVHFGGRAAPLGAITAPPLADP